MDPNVQFLDSIVRGYFSLHHTMSVEVAVCTILMESLQSLRELVQVSSHDGDVERHVPALPNIDALFHSTNFQKTLEEIPVDTSLLINRDDNGHFPDMATWFINQGIVAFLERLDKPYMHATARGFGMSKAAIMKISREKLITCIARVALDPQFHAEPQQETVPSGEAAASSQQHPPIQVSNPRVRTPSRTTPRKQVSHGNSKRDRKGTPLRAGSVRREVRIELFSDVPLSGSVSKKRQNARPSRKRKPHESHFGKEKPSVRPHQLSTPKKGVTALPAEIDLSMLEGACIGYRQVPLRWLAEMEPQMAWKMLYSTNSLPPEELKQYRLPIGPGTSTWQLQQWYFSQEILNYCVENKLHKGKGRKKTLLISLIMKHVRGAEGGQSTQGKDDPDLQDAGMGAVTGGSEEPSNNREREIFQVKSGQLIEGADVGSVAANIEKPAEMVPKIPEKALPQVKVELPFQNAQVNAFGGRSEKPHEVAPMMPERDSSWDLAY
ncbi:Spermidine synthase (methyl transferase) [Perkinsela sp. CCAP 1560/4]|nr:Spermidine synthase (methyl transferase) [Perkinsela sp. CCAP 1560/4]|eukprot:KNH07429.1 Spermidine synthase (methyl transferase) [Perkinsela sp. CCAP 1560/4]